MRLNESIVDAAAMTWFRELGYAVGDGPQLAPDEQKAERVCLPVWSRSAARTRRYDG